MKLNQFADHATQSLFQLNQLSQFEQLWTIDSPWFEAPNYRRNGWSGVIKYSLKDEGQKTHPIFIKRQENHNHKTLLHPIKGIPTFRREYINLQRLKKNNIPSLSCLYYGERKVLGKIQSILISQSLEDYQSFEEFFNTHSFSLTQDSNHNQQLINIMTIAGQNTRLLHDAHFRHGSLYPKHFFVNASQDNIDVRFIDLEKLKWYPFSFLVRFNDLSRIIRRREPINSALIKVFIQAYLQHGKDLSHSLLAKKLYALF
jgi:hypothetical protein